MCKVQKCFASKQRLYNREMKLRRHSHKCFFFTNVVVSEGGSNVAAACAVVVDGIEDISKKGSYRQQNMNLKMMERRY